LPASDQYHQIDYHRMNANCDSSLGYYRRWCFGATLALHSAVLAMPLLGTYLNMPKEQRVEVFLVQSQAREISPMLTNAPSAKSPHSTPLQDILSARIDPVSNAVSNSPPPPAKPSGTTPEEADVTILNSAAGAPPAELPRRDPRYLDNQVNPYPSMSKSLGEEGTVLLRAYVKPDGVVGEVFIMRSSGYARLDNDARHAVGRWKYLPARNGDATVGAWALPISYTFKLQEK